MRITRKRFLTAFLIVLVLLVAAGGTIFYMIGGVGESPLEAWVGRQVKSTLNSYLVPQLEFDEVDYQAPRSVTLLGVRLVADDPDAPGQQVSIFEAEAMRITLGELPRLGKPIVVESVTLERPTVRLVTPQGGGPLIGFSELVKSEPDAEAPPLSEVLQLKLVELIEAQVVLDTREPGTQPTVFDQITTDLNIDAQSGGLYNLALDLDRKPALGATIQAGFDIDAFTLQIDASNIELKLDREHDRYLPQSVQTMIAPYDLTGDVVLGVTGLLDLSTWQDSALDIDLNVEGINALIGDYRVEAERFMLAAQTADRVVQLTRLEGNIFDGEIRGDGVVQISEGYPFDLRLGGTALALEKTLRPTEGIMPKYAGLADFQLSASGPLAYVMTELRGEGTLDIRQGRIARIMVISDIIDFMESAGDLSKPEDAVAGRDRAEVAFRLRGDHAYLSKMELVGSWFAVRGRGNVFFDQSMNVQVNAGPLEKVQDTLGVIGDVFGALTDSMLAYRVSGTTESPSIRPVAFGGLRGAPGDDGEDLPPWSPPAVAPATNAAQEPDVSDESAQPAETESVAPRRSRDDVHDDL
ncbi:MAG: AsmA-like C-terminal region-containing protein [Phycisphaerales bacterium JB063]